MTRSPEIIHKVKLPNQLQSKTCRLLPPWFPFFLISPFQLSRFPLQGLLRVLMAYLTEENIYIGVLVSITFGPKTATRHTSNTSHWDIKTWSPFSAYSHYVNRRPVFLSRESRIPLSQYSPNPHPMMLYSSFQLALRYIQHILRSSNPLHAHFKANFL